MRLLVLAALLLSAPSLAQQPPPHQQPPPQQPPAPEEYVPAPADQIPGYSEKVLPCWIIRGEQTTDGRIMEVPDDAPSAATYVRCKNAPYLDSLPLRELAILRNTIFARYGWAGFRKTWLREHFQQQPWYKPDPKFTSKRLSKIDRENVELIAKAEMSLRYVDLQDRRDKILAKVGKRWADAPTHQGRKRSWQSCDSELVPLTQETTSRHWAWIQEIGESKDCRYHNKAFKNAADPDYSQLSPEDRIELGLLSRAMGEFAVDEEQRDQTAESLDNVLSVKELRLLSLRDLRLLRNTIFARRGRAFKSKVLQEHFARMPWYTPNPKYSDKLLTKTDKRNIELIRQVEEEFGGALQDKDFQVENPSEATDVDALPAYMTV
jgi:hypothetical protein